MDNSGYTSAASYAAAKEKEELIKNQQRNEKEQNVSLLFGMLDELKKQNAQLEKQYLDLQEKYNRSEKQNSRNRLISWISIGIAFASLIAMILIAIFK